MKKKKVYSERERERERARHQTRIFLLPIFSLTFTDKILQQMTRQQVAQTNTNFYSVSQNMPPIIYNQFVLRMLCTSVQ